MSIEPMTLEFSSTPRGGAREEWEALLSQNYAPVACDVHPELPFYGRVTSTSLPGRSDFTLASMAGSYQTFRHSPTHVARSEAYLLVSIHIMGDLVMNQGGRVAQITSGNMVFFDTSAPYHWTNGSDHWTGGSAFEQVVVQVPMDLLRAEPGLGQLVLPTAVTVPAASAAGAVARFFRDLAVVQRKDPVAAAVLARNALGLIASAVLLTAGRRPVDTPADTLRREHVMAFLRDNYTDPELTADDIAAACHISRRTLYRLFGMPGERLRHATHLLADNNHLPAAAVAFASGFASERQFYRVFHHETGTTPGEYRHRCLPPT
ncbi:AraC family transcriptional regulator [Nocardia caishijiensis]|uniref:AraC-like DNA-binding protein n=1 Tax=Nocardia caishijiensis TaxID=184756 RepID=A0ABQ6YRM6_9NOCA|nr:AraC family transcriptional regulator [Nocardia caishijiensis]KAF0848313.1 AraC-like DNA-binding protein [Nocardia caishijiensis]